jgi:hypothetical protein
VPKGCSEVLGGDAQGLPVCLDHVAVRAALDPKHHRHARHALGTNQADLDPTLGGVGQHRYNPVLGKGDVLDRLPRLDQPVSEFEGNGLKIGLEEIEIVQGQGRE